MNRTSTYKPAVASFAAIGSVWVFVLVTLGAFTTTIGAGSSVLATSRLQRGLKVAQSTVIQPRMESINNA